MFLYSTYTLKNGLKTILVPTNSPSVSVQLMVGAGSKDETPEIRGISHFLEHMAFKGTEKRPDTLSISKELDKVGAQFNANTSKERTVYYIVSTPDKLELMLDVLSDITFNSTLKSSEIEKEKGVIAEEINMYSDSPRRKIWDMYGEAIFGDTPIGWGIIGTKDSVMKLKREDFIEFKKNLYVPNNMILSIGGNVSKSDDTIKLIEKWFSPYEKNDTFKRRENKSEFSKCKKLIRKKETEQTQVLVEMPSFHFNDPRKRALNVAGVVLAGNMSSRLFMKIREEKGWAYSVNYFVDYMSENGIFGIAAGLNNSNTNQATAAIKKELIGFADSVTEEEVTNAKNYYKGRLTLSLESSYHVIDIAADYLMHSDRVGKIQDILAEVDRLTLNDIRSVAKSIFKEEEMRLVAIGPNMRLKWS